MEPTKANVPIEGGAPLSALATPVAESPIVRYEDDDEKRNSNMQMVWSNVMQRGKYTSSTEYRKVHVLMLSWDHQFDDLKVEEEMNDLTAVFKETFNYDVTRERLEKRPDKKTQTQVNSLVAGWVDKHDGPKTLLIVYFAGHGRQGNRPGRLEITGDKSPFNVRDYLNAVTWNSAENILSDTYADVLQIFDCCSAGSLGDRGESRAFEYLAACGANQTTRRPGPDSFTRALIWALKTLSAEGAGFFTTSHLSRKILEAPEFPKDQKPIFQRPGLTRSELVMLGPLRLGEEPSSASINPDGSIKSSRAHHQEILTLKFVFEERPDEEVIQTLGQDLNAITHKNGFHINRIMYGGLVPRRSDMVFHAVSQFKKNARRKSSAKMGSLQSPVDLKAAARTFMESFEDKIEKDVQKKMLERMSEEFEAQSSAQRAQRRPSE